MKAAELTSAEINAIMFAFRRTDGFCGHQACGSAHTLAYFPANVLTNKVRTLGKLDERNSH